MAEDKLLMLNEAARSILAADDIDAGPSKPKSRKIISEKTSPKPFAAVTNCCCFQCHEKFPVEEQRNLYERFSRITEKGIQDVFLSSLIDFRPPATVKVEPKRKREFLWRYNINSNGVNTQCCQKFLLRLYQISEKRLRVIQEKTRNGESFGERRGKHSRPKTINGAGTLWDMAEEHLSGLPFTQGLDGTDKKYFKDSSLTIKKVWAMFKEYYETKTGLELVGMSYKTYHKRFSATKKYGFLYQLVIPDEISGKKCLDEMSKTKH